MCALFFIGVAMVVPGDIRTLRAQLQARADTEQALQKAAV
jgi:hypothetical protein